MKTSYRAVRVLSTRILFLAAAVLSVALMGVSRAADFSSSLLPAGALRNSSSLYLREASSSAIRWQPWSDQAFALARSLKRPVLIDIGAVWCHWCHVMDQTTYADPEVARLLNDNFVPIKVDTDQRPDLDSYYQDAASRLTGVSGWPLTCFATSDGALLFAAGYMPPRSDSGPGGSGGDNSAMIPVLNRVIAAYGRDRPKLEQEGDAIAAKLRAHEPKTIPSKNESAPVREMILAALASEYDRSNGGFGEGQGPRFYDFPALRLALTFGFLGHPEFTDMAVKSLRKMAAGGVYDQLGGGFHRYSTDPYWSVPHFEKMGYDQAMALRAYCEAYQASDDPELARVLRSILRYVNSTLLDPKTHGFYSHQDADSFPGDDGSYYTWTLDELKRTLPADQVKAAALYFGFLDSRSMAPNGRVVPRRAMEVRQVASQLHITAEKAAALIPQAALAMSAAREKRKAPKVDRAILTDRNALMARGFLAASVALADPSLRKIALDDLDFILAHMRAPDGSYFHVWNGSGAEITGLIADQVYLMGALVDAYQVSNDAKYLDQARSLADLIEKHYRDSPSGLLVSRGGAQKESAMAHAGASVNVLYDQPVPSVQADAAITIYALAAISGEQRFAKEANDLLHSGAALAGSAAGSTTGTLGLALEEQHQGAAVIAIVGNAGDRRASKLSEVALDTYRPGKIVMYLNPDRSQPAGGPALRQAMSAAASHRNGPLAFLCAGAACANPTGDPARLRDLIRDFGITREAAKTAASAR
ncbi:MAG TPA: thioredoxin domain-containing protein [Candidatus Binataceae bacterium]